MFKRRCLRTAPLFQAVWNSGTGEAALTNETGRIMMDNYGSGRKTRSRDAVQAEV